MVSKKRKRVNFFVNWIGLGVHALEEGVESSSFQCSFFQSCTYFCLVNVRMYVRPASLLISSYTPPSS